jgi:hypothetical protein
MLSDDTREQFYEISKQLNLQGLVAPTTFSLIAQGSSVAGGGTFPILKPFEVQPAAATVDIDLGKSTIHYQSISITSDDTTINFKNPRLDRTVTITLDITINTATFNSITYSPTLDNAPGGLPTTNGSRYQLVIEALKTSTEEKYFVVGGFGGGGGNQTPWLQNVDADGFNLFDLSNLMFRDSTQTLPVGTDTAIWSEGSGSIGMHFNVPSTRSFIFEVNDTTEYDFSAASADWHGNNLANVDTILFTNPVTTIGSISSGLELRIGDTKDYSLWINGIELYTFDQTQLDVHGNDIDDIDRARFGVNTGAVVSNDDPSIFADANASMVYNSAEGTDFGHFWKTGNTTRMTLVTDVAANVILDVVSGDLNGAATFRILKSNPTPSVGITLGQHQWLGTRTGDASLVSYGAISVEYEDIGVGTHSGSMRFEVFEGASANSFMHFNDGNTGSLEIKVPLEMNNNLISNIGGATISGATDIVTVDGAADWLLIFDGSSTTTLKKVKVDDLPSGAASPLTTKGDLYGYDTGDARIPVGTNDMVLQADSTDSLGVAWKFLSTIQDADSSISIIDNSRGEVVLNGLGKMHVNLADVRIFDTGGTKAYLILEDDSTAGIGSIMAQIDFLGEDALGNDHTYAAITSVPRNITNGSETGEIQFWVASNGNDPLSGEVSNFTFGHKNSDSVIDFTILAGNEYPINFILETNDNTTGSLADIEFHSRTTDETVVSYAQITVDKQSVTNGAEDGEIQIWAAKSGTLGVVFEADGGNNQVTLGNSGWNLGFYGSATVTGSRGGNAALADLLTELDTLGLITDSTT